MLRAIASPENWNWEPEGKRQRAKTSKHLKAGVCVFPTESLELWVRNFVSTPSIAEF